MTDLIFATPWWLLGTLIVVGGVIFWSGNKRQQDTPRKIGIALIVLAILLKTLDFFVETDKEKVTRHTNELVTAVQKRDWPTFSSLMDDDVSLGTSNGTICPNRDALVKLAKTDVENHNLANLSAKVTAIQQDAIGITVDLDAFSEVSDSLGYSVPSSWKLTWDKTGNDWHLHEVTCLTIGNDNVNSIGQLIGK